MWLQQLENGKAEWGDYELKMKFRKSLVWHSVAPCTTPDKHPKELNICSYCMVVAKRQ